MKFLLCRCGVGGVESIDRSHSSLLAVPDDLNRHARSLEELVLVSNQVHLKLFFQTICFGVRDTI